MSKIFLFVLFIGLIIRLLLVGNTGFIADISFWKSWSLAAIDNGIVWTTHNTNINYPPGFIYVLWLMGKMYALIGDPHDYNTFWRENNFNFLLVSKSIAILSDIIIACLIYWFFSQKEKLKQLGATLILKTGDASKSSNNQAAEDTNLEDRTDSHNYRYYQSGDTGRKKTGNQKRLFVSEKFGIEDAISLPLLLSSLFFLNPVVIIDSALWGQVESFGILFTIMAIILIFYKRPLLAASIFTIGTLMKLQNIIYIPLFFLFIYKHFDIRTLFKSLGTATLTFFVVNLPFVLANNMDKVLYLLTVNSDYFPWLSLNANNLWWIVAQGAGMQVTDKITVLGILNAKTAGLLLFSCFYLLCTILCYLKPSPRNLFLSLTLGIFAFFLFTTQSHERYSYPVVVLLLFLYPFLESVKREAFSVKKNNNFPLSAFRFPLTNYFWLLYLLLTITIFFNIHMGLVYNYPQSGFDILTRITSPQLTILNSYLLIMLFLLLLPFVFSQISLWFLVLSSSFLVLGLVALNSSYLFKGKVSLTNFKPIISKQDFGVLQTNRSTNSASGWKSWQRLAVNYLYYRKGFGTHANSKLVFDIDRKFKKFSVDMGVDTEAGTPATVVFQIYGDGKKLVESKTLGRFDFPEHAEVDITGVKYLGLEATDAEDGINSDHADWLNPMLYK